MLELKYKSSIQTHNVTKLQKTESWRFLLRQKHSSHPTVVYMTDELQMHEHKGMKKEAHGARDWVLFTLTGVQQWLAPLKSIHFLSNWTSAQFSRAILADGLVNTLPCVPEEKL